MKKQIRHSVFETNSSSSHSLTLGTGALVTQPFSKQVLRDGVVELTVGEYGWEYHRYYTAVEKLNYLLTQITGGNDIPRGSPRANALLLCETHERFAMLCQVVKDYTGCDVAVCTSSGYIDHDSVGVGMELFNNEDTLRNFLFDESACIETSNDNSPGPWRIPTDKGADEFYYAAFLKDVPKSYVAVKLKQLSRYSSIEGFSTEGGGVIGEQLNPELFEKVRARGIAVAAHWDCVDSQPPFEYRNAAGESASRLVGYADKPLMKLSPAFTATHEFARSWNYDDRKEEVVFSVAMPRELASELKALPGDGVVRFHLAQAKRELAYWKKRYEERDEAAGGKPDPWAKKQTDKFAADVLRLTGELSKLTRKPGAKKATRAKKAA